MAGNTLTNAITLSEVEDLESKRTPAFKIEYECSSCKTPSYFRMDTAYFHSYDGEHYIFNYMDEKVECKESACSKCYCVEIYFTGVYYHDKYVTDDRENEDD